MPKGAILVKLPDQLLNWELRLHSQNRVVLKIERDTLLTDFTRDQHLTVEALKTLVASDQEISIIAPLEYRRPIQRFDAQKVG